MRGKSRDAALLLQMCTSMRLRASLVSHINSLYDMTDAFYCSDRSTYLSHTVASAIGDDESVSALLTDRVMHSTIQFGHGEDAITVRPSSGSPPGDSTAANTFSENIRECYADFIERISDHCIKADLEPILNEKAHIDLSLSVYADDIYKKLVPDPRGGFEAVRRAVATADRDLMHTLGNKGYVSNPAKNVLIPSIVGPEALAVNKQIYANANLFGCQVCHHARYLGPQIPRTRYHSQSDSLEFRKLVQIFIPLAVSGKKDLDAWRVSCFVQLYVIRYGMQCIVSP